MELILNEKKYLGLIIDVKTKWKKHVKIKFEEIKIRYRKFYWALIRKSNLSIQNKLLIGKAENYLSDD